AQSESAPYRSISPVVPMICTPRSFRLLAFHSTPFSKTTPAARSRSPMGGSCRCSEIQHAVMTTVAKAFSLRHRLDGRGFGQRDAIAAETDESSTGVFTFGESGPLVGTAFAGLYCNSVQSHPCMDPMNRS